MLQRSSRELALSLVKVGKSFGNFRAIDNVNLEVGEGEVFGLLGPNGAGKTTTMRIISCLLSPTDGEVYVNGKSVKDHQNRVAISREIGLLTESPNIYERLSAEQNLAFFARAYGVPEDQIEARITRVLGDFDLLGRRKDKVGTFSRGMKQKLAIARALVHKPSILLLDEPTVGLDAESARAIRTQISETAESGGHTVLLSTHNLDDASRLCDRIAILSNGVIMAQGTEAEIEDQIRLANRRSGAFEKPAVVRIGLVNPLSVRPGDLAKSLPEIINITPLLPEFGSGIEVWFDPRYFGKDADILTARAVSNLVLQGAEVTGVSQLRPSLEDMYLEIVAMARGRSAEEMSRKEKKTEARKS